MGLALLQITVAKMIYLDVRTIYIFWDQVKMGGAAKNALGGD